MEDISENKKLKFIEAAGKTVDIAIEKALMEADLTIDKVNVEIISLGSKGILGIGSREAKVRISFADKEEEILAVSDSTSPLSDSYSEVVEYAKQFLDGIFKAMKINPTCNVDIKEDILWLSFVGDNLGILIGRRGETLNSLQYLVNLTVNKRVNNRYRIVLDVEDYRARREETLSALAKKMADKVVRSGRNVELEPMNPHERRVIHMALQDDKRVQTFSRGEEPYRKIVITKKSRY